jgi:hypothetical protein
MKEYNVGTINELPIVFVYLTDDYIELEKCLKDCLKQYQIKSNQEKYYIDLDFIKETIKYCTIRKAILLKQNKKLLNQKDNKKFVIILDNENINYAEELLKPTKNIKKNKSQVKKINKKKSKKTSKTIKKISKKKNIKKNWKN